MVSPKFIAVRILKRILDSAGEQLEEIEYKSGDYHLEGARKSVNLARKHLIEWMEADREKGVA